MRRPSMCGVLLLAPALGCAAGTPALGWDLSGSFRLRSESLWGQPRTAFVVQDQWTSTRATVQLEHRGESVRWVAELWDSRVPNAGADSTVSANDINALELVQAYVHLEGRDLLGQGSRASLQLGRFSLNLGSRRLVAADDYRNTTNGFTGARAELRGAAGSSATLFYTLPQQRRPDRLPDVLDHGIRSDDEGPDQRLYGALWQGRRDAWGAVAEASWIAYDEHDGPGRATRDRRLDTLGLRWFRDARPGQWDWELEAMRQTGSARDGTAAQARLRPVEAHFLHARVGYQWAMPWKPRLAFDYDAVEGDRGSGRNTRFDTLFGMRRADFAPAGLYNLVGRANLVSPGLRLEVAPDARQDLMATVRGLWLESATDSMSNLGLRDARGEAGRHFGTQLDARWRYWLQPQRLRLEVNAVHLAQGRALREVAGSRGRAGTQYLAVSLQANF